MKFTITTLLSLIGGTIFGQVTLTTTPYSENFDGISTSLPSGWSGRFGANATSLGSVATLTTTATAWNNTTAAFKNCASADGLTSTSTSTEQSNSTDRSLSVRQSGTSGDPGAAFVLQLANTTGKKNLKASFKIQSLDVTSPRSTNWTVEYGLGATPTTFNSPTVTGSLTTGSSSFANNTITVDFGSALDNFSDNVWVRIVALTGSGGSGSRPTTGIDDFELTFEDISLGLENVILKDFKYNSLVKDNLYVTVLNPSLLNVYGIDGRLVGSYKIQNETAINLSNLSKGNYVITLESEGKKISRKIIKE